MIYYISYYINYKQNDWILLLLFIEFIYNIIWYSIININLFQIIYRFQFIFYYINKNVDLEGKILIIYEYIDILKKEKEKLKEFWKSTTN